ncbi:MAG: cell division protein SepF [Candidatus Izemoplasmatales bacterium]|jgi:FtsZ-interacting cell division protein YlmF|nr:cell division protein SepF [Candidatus Izemoplasmatales bacterium]MDY0011113.1 cell division protein SepF [Candidatus Izemoplasmatales bacterium]
MGLFSKNKITPTNVDFEDLTFVKVNDNKDVYKYAEIIMHRMPIVLNFTDCLISEANEVLMFLTGVLYACDGEIVKIKDKIYLMAQKSDLLGPTLSRFINEYRAQ